MELIEALARAEAAEATVEKLKLVALNLMREAMRPSNSIYVAGIIQDAAARIGVALGYDPDEIGWDEFIEKLEGK